MPVQMHPETAVGELKAGDYAFPLQAVDVRGTVRGLLYSAVVTQKFRNERDTRMEAVYTFPLPPKAAVHTFTLTIGDRVIEGEIKERGQARREYKQAIRSGHRAAMMEEERSDIFTTTVGNIGPGEEVEIKFEMSGPMSCFKNTSRLRLPLVVGEVFIPGRELAGKSVGDGVALDTDEVPDASRITPPRLADGVPNPVALNVSFMIEPSGLNVSGVQSTCHFARTKQYQDGRFRVSLLPGVEKMDRAFVLEVTYPENTLQTSLLVDKEKKAFALTVVPPVAKERQTHPRDVVIVLDRSGSMNGWLMVAARRAAARIIDSLTPDDRFGIIAFDDRNDHFDRRNGLCHANNFYKMRAAEFLSKVDARGGTQMQPALREGLSYFNQAANRDPHVILLTDGDVGNDSSLIRSAQTGIRISTIGIGYAAREGLLNRIAETSGGICSLIPNESDLEQELVEMHRKWGQPVWKGLTLRGADDQFRSPKFWDVWQDVPTTFFGRLDDIGAKTEVSGWFQDRGQHSQELTPVETEDPTIYRAWARSRLLDLEDLFLVNKATPADLVSLSVSAKVLCRFTAFTAIDKSEKVNVEQEMQRVAQPVEQTIQRKSAVLASKPMLSRRSGSAAPGSPPMLRSRPAPPPPPSPDAGGWLGGADDQDHDDGGLFDDACLDSEDLFCEEPAMECFSIEPEVTAEAEPLFEMLLEAEAPVKDVTKERKMELPSLSMPKMESAAPASPKAEDSTVDGMANSLRAELAKDALLNHTNPPGRDKVWTWIKLVEKMIATMTDALKLNKVSGERANRWREALAKLMDYQEALEELRQGGSLFEAKTVRKEVDEALARL